MTYTIPHLGSRFIGNIHSMYAPETSEKQPDNISRTQKPIETMKDPGYHIGKIDTATLNTLSDFGLKVNNGKDANGVWVLELNSDDKFGIMLYQNGKLVSWDNPVKDTLQIDGNTLKMEAQTTTIKGQKVLWVRIINKDGTTDSAIFIPDAKEAQKSTFDLSTIYPIETITTFDGKSTNEQFGVDTKSVFETAKKNGIDLKYDNSRSNGIDILDKNGAFIGKIRVFMNQNWKTDLINSLKKINGGK